MTEVKLPNQEKIRMLGDKAKLEILRNIESEQYQTSGDERKIRE